jgi:hypothetical protein
MGYHLPPMVGYAGLATQSGMRYGADINPTPQPRLGSLDAAQGAQASTVAKGAWERGLVIRGAGREVQG